MALAHTCVLLDAVCKLMFKPMNPIDVKTCRATRNPEFSQKTGPKLIRDQGTFLRVFSGQVGLGGKDFGPVRVRGVFLNRDIIYFF